MTLDQRITLTIIVDIFVVSMLAILGAGWWSFLVIPYGYWNFYDGRTRSGIL